jgi:hypothetical protein
MNQKGFVSECFWKVVLDETHVQYGNNGIHETYIPTTTHIGSRYRQTISMDVGSGLNHWALHGVEAPRGKVIDDVTLMVKDKRDLYNPGTIHYMACNNLYGHMLALQWEYTMQESHIEPPVPPMVYDLTNSQLIYYPTLYQKKLNALTTAASGNMQTVADVVPDTVKEKVVDALTNNIYNDHQNNILGHNVRCLMDQLMYPFGDDARTYFQKIIDNIIPAQQLYDMRQCDNTSLVRSKVMDNGVCLLVLAAMASLFVAWLVRHKHIANPSTSAVVEQSVVDLDRYLEDKKYSIYINGIESQSVIMEAARLDQHGPIDDITGLAMYKELFRMKELDCCIRPESLEDIKIQHAEVLLLTALSTKYGKFEPRVTHIDGSHNQSILRLRMC